MVAAFFLTQNLEGWTVENPNLEVTKYHDRPKWGQHPTYIELDPVDDNGTFKLLSKLTLGRYRTQLCNAHGTLNPFW